MFKNVILAAFIASTVFLSGCATIVTGPRQKVPVNSIPSGAVAKVDGGISAVTPTVFNLERKMDHTIQISKEGYRTANIILKHTVSGATCGNALVGGIIGIAVDGCTGAMFKLVPEKVNVTLRQGDESASIEPPKQSENANIPKKDAI